MKSTILILLSFLSLSLFAQKTVNIDCRAKGFKKGDLSVQVFTQDGENITSSAVSESDGEDECILDSPLKQEFFKMFLPDNERFTLVLRSDNGFEKYVYIWTADFPRYSNFDISLNKPDNFIYFLAKEGRFISLEDKSKYSQLVKQNFKVNEFNK